MKPVVRPTKAHSDEAMPRPESQPEHVEIPYRAKLDELGVPRPAIALDRQTVVIYQDHFILVAVHRDPSLNYERARVVGPLCRPNANASATASLPRSTPKRAVQACRSLASTFKANASNDPVSVCSAFVPSGNTAPPTVVTHPKFTEAISHDKKLCPPAKATTVQTLPPTDF
jgi:hypothetical protein